MILIYCQVICSVLEYACAIWHNDLTITLYNDVERVQRRCLHIIYPDLSYSDALSVSGLERLSVVVKKSLEIYFMRYNNPVMRYIVHFPQGPILTSVREITTYIPSLQQKQIVILFLHTILYTQIVVN